MSLLARSPYPAADTLEILQGDTAIGAFSIGDDLLRNDMVDVLGESSFLPASFDEKSLGALRPLVLEALAQPVGASAQTVDVAPGEVLPITRGCDVDDADIYAKPSERLTLFGVGDVDTDEEVELLVAQHEVSLAPFVLEQDSLRMPQTKETRWRPLVVQGLAFPSPQDRIRAS